MHQGRPHKGRTILTGTQAVDIPSSVSRRPWQAQQRFMAYGTEFLLRVNRSSALPALLAWLPLGCVLIPEQDGSAPHHSYSIAFSDQPDFSAVINRDGRRVAVCHSEAQLLAALRLEIVARMVENSRERVFIHSGVVGWRGQAILIPGRSTHGKTTLVTRFLEAGATYYSDEFALLDSAGYVHPYARQLQVRLQKDSLIQTAVPASEIGGTGGIGKDAIPPMMLLACRYREGAKWRPTEITPGAATLELTRHCASANRNPEAAFHATSQAASRLRAWRGARGEALHVVEWALKLLDAGY